MRPSRRKRATVALVSLLAVSGCRGATRAASPKTLPFEQILNDSRTVPLSMPSENPLLEPIAATARGDQLVIVDQGQADLKVVERASGRLLRIVGQAGDGAGDFRRPVDIALLDSGQFAVLDNGRQLISFRDSLGEVRSEVRTPSLSWAMLALLPERRLVVPGPNVSPRDYFRKTPALHVLDFQGHVERSLGKAIRPRSYWEESYSTVLLTHLGDQLLVGSMNSNRVRIVDPHSAYERWLAVAEGWYKEPSWPQDGPRGEGPQSTIQRMRVWARQQCMTNGLFSLGTSRFLTRFLAFDSTGARTYFYAVTDTAGRTLAITKATTAFVLTTVGDTAIWIAKTQDGKLSLGSGIVSESFLGVGRRRPI